MVIGTVLFMWALTQAAGQAGAGCLRAPIDDEGVYWVEADSLQGVAAPISSYARRMPHDAVPCRLVDFVDCSQTDHEFVDDSKSHVVTLAGRPFRLTDSGVELSWFSYQLATRPRPGRPHLLVAELINDRERYTTVTVSVPKGLPWAAPYTGEESFQPDCMEPDGYHPDVGACVYTGREYPTDGRPFNFCMLVYPKAAALKVTISHRGNEQWHDELNGAAVSRLWLFEIPGRLPRLRGDEPEEAADDAVSHPQQTLTPSLSRRERGLVTSPPRRGRPAGTGEGARGSGEKRRVGLYFPHPWYLCAHFGVPSRTRAQRLQSLRSAVEYLRFCGVNLLQFHVINGSDTASRAWYDSELYRPLQGNLLEELLPLCEEADIEVRPIVAPIFTDLKGAATHSDEPSERGFTRLSLQVPHTGEAFSSGMGKPAPDPLRPEVGDWLIKCLTEIAARCRPFRCVRMIGLRVNGKIGLCYTGASEEFCGQHSGYSGWDIAQFEQDTGLTVSPAEGQTAYDWLQANAWEEWLQWRCVRMCGLWLRARDALQEVRPDLKLLVACDLPSEVPGYNIEWPAGETPRDLLRHHGYDPALFVDDEGILIQRGMMVNSDRFYTSWGPPFGENVWAHKAYNYADGQQQCFITREPPSV